MRLRVGCLALCLLLCPAASYSQAITVSPNCGTTDTHFIVSGGGLPRPPKTCPDSCSIDASILLDNNGIYAGGNCGAPFAIDLQNVPGHGCVACGLVGGAHVLKLFSHNLECSGDTQPRDVLCAQTTFQIVGSTGDPWSAGETLTFDGQTIILNHYACETCDIAPCRSIVFVQTIRPMAKDSLGNLTPYSYAQQDWDEAARYDSLRTVAGHRIDVGPNVRVPYYLGNWYGGAIPVATIGNKVGSGSGCGSAAAIQDDPARDSTNFQPDVAAIVLEFEDNAFCAGGEGQGQWLGRCTWSWRKPLIGADVITLGTCTRSQPTTQFMDALNLWKSLREFALPTPPIPTTGGVACN